MFEIIISKLPNNTSKTSTLQNLKKMSFNLENNSITTLSTNKRRRESDANDQDITKKLKFEELRIEQNPIESTMEDLENETVEYLKQKQ